jgi:hypothetical protein
LGDKWKRGSHQGRRGQHQQASVEESHLEFQRGAGEEILQRGERRYQRVEAIGKGDARNARGQLHHAVSYQGPPDAAVADERGGRDAAQREPQEVSDQHRRRGGGGGACQKLGVFFEALFRQ